MTTPKKLRINSCIDPAVHAAGVKLAGKKQLSFSALIERLVRRETKKAGLLVEVAG